MRPIKFRGKRVDNGEWVCGYYAVLPKFTLPVAAMGEESYCEDGADYIIEFKTMQHPNFSSAYPLQVCDKEIYEVDPETVGQFTDLRDDSEDEKEAYESDIAEFEFEGVLHRGVIKYEAGMFILACDGLPDGYIPMFKITEFDREFSWIRGKIIGNTHDNPELLK